MYFSKMTVILKIAKNVLVVVLYKDNVLLIVA